MVEIFSGSPKTLKVATNLQLRCCWSVLFCISEELTETNVQVQFRVIPSFKFHNLKGFYSANCLGVTQKLASSVFFLLNSQILKNIYKTLKMTLSDNHVTHGT